MATTRIMPLHVGKGRTESRAISDIIDYVANPKKTDNGRLITGYACDSRTADAEFLLAKRQYIAATGRVRGTDDVIAYHVRQSFRPGEITQEEANRLGVEFAKRFTKGNHAFVVCTHIDKSHIHNHIIWSSVSLEYDRKFRNFWGSSRAVRRLNDTICIENGYSIVENPKRHGKSYNKWLGDKKKPSHRERICTAIDDALAQKPDSFEALLELLLRVREEFGIPRDRVFLAGNSMGGMGCFHFAARHRDIIRAIAPAGAAPEIASFDYEALAGLPIFFTAGTQDHHGFRHLKDAADHMKRLGLSVTFRPVEGSTHQYAWVEDAPEWFAFLTKREADA